MMVWLGVLNTPTTGALDGKVGVVYCLIILMVSSRSIDVEWGWNTKQFSYIGCMNAGAEDMELAEAFQAARSMAEG